MMQQRLTITAYLLVLIILGVGLSGCSISFENLISGANSSYPPSTAVAQAAAPTEEDAAKITSPQGSGPQVGQGTAWADAPPCVNEPLNVDEWQPLLSGGDQPGLLGRASSLALEMPGLQLQSTAAETGEAQDATAQVYEALLLNVATGRLNRATEISLPEFPEIKTVGDLIAQMDLSMEPSSGPAAVAPMDQKEAYAPAIEQILSGEAISRAVCAQLVVMRNGSQIEPLLWAADGVQEQASSAASLAAMSAANTVQAGLDYGTASPDGVWAAYTSISYDAGGPVFLQNLQSGMWVNLIEAMNASQPKDEPRLNDTDWWTVIDWFPDSRRLMLGRYDVSSVFVVDLADYSFRVYAFPAEGNGGTAVVDLAPDGSQFVYVGWDESGGQVLNTVNLADGSTTTLLNQTAEAGWISFPRYSPDGSRIAYLLQQGDPLSGISYSIQALNTADSTIITLVPENVGITVPVWSPDGQYIAFTRSETGEPFVVIPEQAPVVEKVNVWVVNTTDLSQQQLTFVEGQARHALWANDAKTLAFITHEGQVGMVTLDLPGRMWRAGEPSPEQPLLTSVFFVP